MCRSTRQRSSGRSCAAPTSPRARGSASSATAGAVPRDADRHGRRRRRPRRPHERCRSRARRRGRVHGHPGLRGGDPRRDRRLRDHHRVRDRRDPAIRVRRADRPGGRAQAAWARVHRSIPDSWLLLCYGKRSSNIAVGVEPSRWRRTTRSCADQEMVVSGIATVANLRLSRRRPSQPQPPRPGAQPSADDRSQGSLRGRYWLAVEKDDRVAVDSDPALLQIDHASRGWSSR